MFLTACGDDDGGTKTPDAGVQIPDAAPSPPDAAIAQATIGQPCGAAGNPACPAKGTHTNPVIQDGTVVARRLSSSNAGTFDFGDL